MKHAGLRLDAIGQSITSPIGFGQHDDGDEEEEDVQMRVMMRGGSTPLIC